MVQLCAALFALLTVMHQPWKHTHTEENTFTPFLQLTQKTAVTYTLKQTRTQWTLQC